MHEHDWVPRFLLDAQRWLIGLLSYDRRLLFGIMVIGIGIAIAVVLSGASALRIFFTSLDVLALVGLFLVNWIGNGGVLVPIPGARLIGLLMIFQHAVILPSWEVLAVSGTAMALGLLSYYLVGARATEAYLRGDAEHAEELAMDTGVLAQANGDDDSLRHRFTRRFADSWQKARERAQPAIERHGIWGMFWLCFTPTPLGTAAAFLGGAMGFGFARYLLASFTSKFLLAAIIIVVALFLAEGARRLVGGL